MAGFDAFDRMRRWGRRDRDSLRTEQLRQQAIAWLLLISSGKATVADGEVLKRWCREDPAHAEAYRNVAHVWELLTPVAAGASPPLFYEPARATRMNGALGRRAFLGGAIAASAGCAAYAAINPPFALWPSLEELGADIRTGTGERRRLEISRGVAIDLNTRSSLALATEGGDNRYVRLISGEAVVAVGPTIDRTCVVVAGAGRIVASDARVDLRHDDARVGVVCLEGSVRVEHRAGDTTLSASQQVFYDDRTISSLNAVDAAVVTAWQQGRLIFRKERLAHLIDEVNRYRSGRIVLLDRGLGDRLIDASFQLNSLDTVIVYLQQAFDARITRLPGGVVLVG